MTFSEAPEDLVSAHFRSKATKIHYKSIARFFNRASVGNLRVVGRSASKCSEFCIRDSQRERESDRERERDKTEQRHGTKEGENERATQMRKQTTTHEERERQRQRERERGRE